MALEHLFPGLPPEDREAMISLLRTQLARRRRSASRAVTPSKRCPTCAEELPTSAFARDATRRDGLRGQCRECGRKARQARLEEEAKGWE